MIWKHGEGVTIDLRKAQSERQGSSITYRFLLAALGTVAAISLASLTFGILTVARPSDLPFEGLSLGLTMDEEGREGTEWNLGPIRDPSQGLQEHDEIISLNGEPPPAPSTPPQEQRRYFEQVQHSPTTTYLVRREERIYTEYVITPLSRSLGWSTEDPRELEFEVSLVRPPWHEAALRIGTPLLLFLIVGVGFLALRARSEQLGIPRFVSLCLLLGFLSLPGLMVSAIKWKNPYYLFGDVPRFIHNLWPWLPGIAFLWILLFLAAFMSLLRVFPTPDTDLSNRYRIARSVWVLGIVGLTLASLVLGFFQMGYDYVIVPTRTWFGSHSAAMSAPRSDPLYELIGYYVAMLAWACWLTLTGALAIRTFQLARARLRSTEAEALQQARLALLGVKLGLLLLLVGVFFPRAATMNIPWTFTVYDAVGLIKSALLRIGIILPFVGFFFAITRHGLWDVDLIRKRAVTVSTLTVIFFIAWLGLEIVVETTFEQLGGTLGAPLLAAGLVAVSQRRVTQGITRRFFPQSVDFDRAIAEISEQLSTAESGTSAAKRLGICLSEALGADPCAVLVRIKDRLEQIWSNESTADLAAVAVAAEAALGEHRSAIVMTDDGPILAARIGTGAAFPGMLLLGPRRGGQFYSTEDRRLLGVLLNQAAMALKQTA